MAYNSRIDYLGLHAFLAIAERGSFRDAAVHLNVSHTAISHRIRKLEEELGQRLLSRTTREVTLTQAGLDLLPEVKETIAKLSASLDALKQKSSSRHNSLSIACLPTIASGRLPLILKRFENDYPKVTIQIHDTGASEITELVHAGTVEFGITLIASHRWDFELEVLIEDQFVVACPQDHVLAERPRVNWADLKGYPLIRVSQHLGNRMIIDDAMTQAGIELNWRYEPQRLETAVAMAKSGVALAVVPRMAFRSAGDSELQLCPLHSPSVKRQLGIVSRRGAPLSPVAEKLRALVREMLV